MSLRDSQKLKQLESRKVKLEEECLSLKQDYTHTSQSYNRIKQKLDALNKQIEELKVRSSDLIITEHAVLRFLERTDAVNIEQIKIDIVSDSTKTAVKALGDGQYPIGEGLHIVVKNNTVVTVK